MNFRRTIRTYHRYLGIIIGIQFLFWTLGGLYFSWTNIEDIRGNTLKKAETYFSKDLHFPDINPIIDSLNSSGTIDSIKQVELKQLKNKAYILLTYFSSSNSNIQEEKLLIDFSNNKNIKEISAHFAGEIAQNSMKDPVEILAIHLLNEDSINNHHEYRGGIFPVYAVHMKTTNKLTIYIDAQSGEVLKFRTQKWRIFDFLWMMHTMDYSGRDNFNNWVLRAFAILGLLTLLSGFILYFSTSSWLRKKNSF